MERFKNNILITFSMLPQQEIQKYGGKGAILNHIKEKLPEIPIPNYVIKEAGSNINSVLPEFQKMEKPVIVRSSSPYEYGDFEGIFDSVLDVHDNHDLEYAIRKVEESATSKKATEYAKQNGFQIDGKINAIIQEQSDSRYNGAIMRHPNNPDLIFIGYSKGREMYKQHHYTFLFDETTQSSGDNRVFCSSEEFDEKDAKFLVEQYKKIESLENITKDHSLFVEFGYDPFWIYQARPFKKIETSDFKLPEFDHDKDIWSDFVFGITPPEGIVLPVIKSIGFREASYFSRDMIKEFGLKGEDELLSYYIMEAAFVKQFEGDKKMIEHLSYKLREWHLENEEIEEYRPYCLMTTSAHDANFDVDLSVPNMKGLVLGRANNFLVHGLMRLFKKASITVGIPLLQYNNLYLNAISHEDKVRMICNGKEGIVIKE